MMLLASCSDTTLDRYTHPCLGRLVVPGQGIGNVGTARPYAVDNGAFTGFDEPAFLHMLDRLAGRPGCLFVAAPDVVGDADATLQLYAEWGPALQADGWPAALVAQDGLTVDTVPWRQIDALFIGGTDLFKLGPDTARLLAEANRRGLWTHVGRVNTHQRLRWCKAHAVDSVDGTSFVRWRDTYLPDFLKIAAEPVQPMLHGTW